ncbi:bifunctional demethylmenaquinone methyltransferase/2-methoxy-6-polyprenyl-1,4-benzoquinol methylase UbiE [Helicobacter ailurogastricus]|uniref:Demethylmenaquinone methyltransferase n=1 Tax=Helicobacter ailurogastricus TaxID=1578720 RepID=A0A0K2X3G7_9HELI|nr:bifunctional demethylmenaquinone methyltransferase/2-methoxy-6-polyprenyl-1,4-benzoquinol methylase UbiE [Helicobacter ailurogastricus]GMB89923.1 Ubiquinone/menaquinone biosynthesis methyltransferase UbiE [Helicobacter ailurogastricus]CRF41560.1 Demethylmenaquinone methyltransferase [Helicobacter ailurogastricus]CRF43253.1 Demethylmenaquinone methyltransferase [Helicobacter ailurogastricus]CRF44945.1 Demethylmenaquinone methyltransferase [Helicobacter ailurogastricus]
MAKHADKQQQIIGMFDSIAKTYDTANKVVSFKQDHKWRKESVQEALRHVYAFRGDLQGLNVADIACGTADMLLCILENIAQFRGSVAEVCGIDPSTEMLRLAEQKIATNPISQNARIRLDCLEAKNLRTLADHSIDLLSIAYGLRNVVERLQALEEFSRVLKKGGVLLVLDFMRQDKRGILGHLAHLYTSKILPFVGMLISHNYKAYAYLPDSIEKFISADELEEEINSVGLEVVGKSHYMYKSVSGIFAVKL